MATDQGEAEHLDDEKYKEMVGFYLQGHSRVDTGILDLPTEVIHMIANNFDNQTLCRFAAASRWYWDIFQPICHKKALKGEGLTKEKSAALGRGESIVEVPTMPLFNKAVANGYQGAVRSFLEHGINPNSSYRYSPHAKITISALNQAINLRDAYGMAELLLSYGADPSLENLWGGLQYRPSKAPVRQAATKGDSRLVRLLLKNGAKVDTGEGIHEFFHNCDAAVVSHLVENGFDLNDRSNLHRFYFHDAAANKNGRGVLDLMASLSPKLLAEEINRYDGRGMTLLTTAIESKQEENILAVLEYGADPNETVQTLVFSAMVRVSPLLLACSSNLETAVSALIGAGADIEFVGRNRAKVIHYAVQISASMTKKVLEAGADVHAVTAYDNSPLHIACMPRSSEVRLLHNHGQVDMETVELLLNSGASVDARNALGLTPIDVAKRYNSHSFVAAMQQSQNVG